MNRVHPAPGGDAYDNPSGRGGLASCGIAHLGTGLTLTNSTVSGNTAPLGGGVGTGFGAPVSLTNSTISGNIASGFSGGGGIYSPTAGPPEARARRR